jgi:glycosyltransferase involved in cell wall biosynthesis
VSAQRLVISAVIPTKNRPADLARAVQSVLAQTRPPDELLIIDQSEGEDASRRVHAMFTEATPTRLVYVHDPSIAGLVYAKRAAVARAAGEIICFLEDDIVLEAAYLAEIEAGFVSHPLMSGCSGVITNLPSSSRVYVALNALFFQGIFRDPRIRIFTATSASSGLTRCDILSGGLSCWRRKVFEHVDLDTRNGFFMLEDIEFSTRVVRAFGNCLFVNSRARLAHLSSPINRDVQMALQRRRLVEAISYYKKRRSWPGARVGLLGALLWWLGDAIGSSLRFRSPRSLIGYVQGAIDGINKPVVM